VQEVYANYKVLKQVHLKTSAFSNSFVNDIFERIAGESSRLANHNKCSAVSSREIQTTFCLLHPSELAISEGTKAFSKYTKQFLWKAFQINFRNFSLLFQIGNLKFKRGTTYFIEY